MRKHRSVSFSLSSFSTDAKVTSFLTEKFYEKKNILLIGPTGSGKTSLLSALLALSSEQEHLICIEDTQEINIPHQHCTSFVIGPEHQATLEDFLSYSLRLRPDRILLGEIRSNEVIPFTMALNTGHRGMMATLHANSGMDAIDRLILLFSLYANFKTFSPTVIGQMICKSLDYVVYLENKRIISIGQVLGHGQNGAMFEEIFSA